jgi:hypothetical protein
MSNGVYILLGHSVYFLNICDFQHTFLANKHDFFIIAGVLFLFYKPNSAAPYARDRELLV